MFFQSKAVKRVLRNNEQLKSKLETLEIELDSLLNERRNLKDDIESLKSKKKIDEEDIKHMVKMREERLNLEFQKKEVAMEKATQDKLHNISNLYRDKTESQLETQADNMKEIYGKILERLPNISAKFSVKE